MSNFNRLFKHFSQPSLEAQVVEIVKENSQQVVENNPPISLSGTLVIESLKTDSAMPSEEGTGEVQSKKVIKSNKKKGSKKKKIGEI